MQLFDCSLYRQSQSKGALQSKVSNQENKSLKARLKINKIETKAMQINSNNFNLPQGSVTLAECDIRS